MPTWMSQPAPAMLRGGRLFGLASARTLWQRLVPLCLLLASWPATAGEAPVLTLDEAEALAKRQSPRVAAARHEAAALRAQADRERPAFRPEVSLSASQDLHVPRVRALFADGLDTVEPLSRSRAEVALSQTVYRYGGRAAARRANSLDRAADAQAARAEADAVLEVKRTYFALGAAERLEQVAVEAVGLAEAHLKLVSDMLEGGTAARSDLLRAEVEVSEARLARTRAANGVELARAALNRTLGRDLDAPVRVAAPGALPPDPGPLPGLVAAALRDRPDLQALRAQVAAAESGVALARGQRTPTLSLTTTLSRQTESAFVPATLLRVGLVARWPLLDGGRARHDRAEAEARLAQLRALLAEAEQGVALEVRQGWLAVREARERAEVEERNVTAAAEAATIAELRFQQGATTQLEAIDARLTLRRARANHAQAVYDALTAWADLEHRVGGRL